MFLQLIKSELKIDWNSNTTFEIKKIRNFGESKILDLWNDLNAQTARMQIESCSVWWYTLFINLSHNLWFINCWYFKCLTRYLSLHFKATACSSQAVDCCQLSEFEFSNSTPSYNIYVIAVKLSKFLLMTYFGLQFDPFVVMFYK